MIYIHNLMKQYVASIQTVNMALNLSQELTTEIPKLDGPTYSIDADQVMEVAAPAEDLTETQWATPHSLISEYGGLSSEKPGRTALVAHDIELTSDVPVNLRPYTLAPRQQEILKEEL